MNTVFANNMVPVETLMWYDGPIIVHYRDDKHDFLMLWSDVEWKSSQEQTLFYLVCHVTRNDMAAYLANKITTLSLMKRSMAIYECVEQAIPDKTAVNGVRWTHWLENGVATGRRVEFNSIPADSLPSKNSYLRPKEANDTSSN